MTCAQFTSVVIHSMHYKHCRSIGTAWQSMANSVAATKTAIFPLQWSHLLCHARPLLSAGFWRDRRGCGVLTRGVSVAHLPPLEVAGDVLRIC